MARANSGIKFSGVSSGGLTVEEQDGVPTVVNVNTIRVSNGTLTDEGGGIVSITTGGGGGGGTPSSPFNSVQYNNAGSFGGSSQFIYDSANQRVGIGNSSPARKLDIRETTTQLRLEYDATDHTDIYTDDSGSLQIVPSGGVVTQPTALDSNIRHASYVLDAATTDATITVMTIKPGSGAMTLVDNSTWFFDAMVVGKQDSSANSITVKLEGAVNRNGAGASILGGVLNLIVYDSSLGTWNVSATVAGNNLQISVTGVAATIIDWSAHVRTTEVED